MWYSFASFEVEGNWNKLTKKFCEKFFPISKVQHLRRQVITFTQGEEEWIHQAWNRYNELIEQGPRLGISGDVLLHTFFFSLTPSCMQCRMDLPGPTALVGTRTDYSVGP
jgi:hypothetical protein